MMTNSSGENEGWNRISFQRGVDSSLFSFFSSSSSSSFSSFSSAVKISGKREADGSRLRLEFPTSAPVVLALPLPPPPATTAYTTSPPLPALPSEHNGARIHLGQPYPPPPPPPPPQPPPTASPSAPRRSRRPSFSSYLGGTASRNNSIFLCEYNFAFNLFSPLFPSPALLLSHAPRDPNQQPWIASLSLRCVSLSPPFRSLPRRVAFSTNLLRHLQPPSTEDLSLSFDPAPSLPLFPCLPPSLVLFLSFRHFPPATLPFPAQPRSARPFLSSCFHPTSPSPSAVFLYRFLSFARFVRARFFLSFFLSFFPALRSASILLDRCNY